MYFKACWWQIDIHYIKYHYVLCQVLERIVLVNFNILLAKRISVWNCSVYFTVNTHFCFTWYWLWDWINKSLWRILAQVSYITIELFWNVALRKGFTLLVIYIYWWIYLFWVVMHSSLINLKHMNNKWKFIH